jgi:Na+/melibiose symporter-like transporter
VPKLYVDRFDLSLAWIGGILLATRVLDAATDPWWGSLIDRHRHDMGIKYRRWIVLGAVPLVAAYASLFGLPAMATPGELDHVVVALWLAVSLVVVYGAYSLITIAYQAWGAEVADDPADRARVVAARELPGIAGVVVSSLLAAATAFVAQVALLGSTLLLAVVALKSVPLAPGELKRQDRMRASSSGVASGEASCWVPFRYRNFTHLYCCFVCNGIASAIPATLFLFFVRDVLGEESRSGLLLALYFLAAACSTPLWVALSARIGLARAWAIGMAFALIAFAGTSQLGVGDINAFAWICAFTGMALGADLALPAAMLAGVVDTNGHAGHREAGYFGLWNMAAKFNLAIAAGVSLPLIGLLGYDPHQLDDTGREALRVAYALVPCAFKCLALVLVIPMCRASAPFAISPSRGSS